MTDLTQEPEIKKTRAPKKPSQATIDAAVDKVGKYPDGSDKRMEATEALRKLLEKL